MIENNTDSIHAQVIMKSSPVAFEFNDEEKPIYLMRVNKILVYYVNVGQLPPDNALKFVNKVQSTAQNLINRLAEQGCEMMFIPVREGLTRIEIINL